MQKLFYNLNYADAKVTKFYFGSTVEWLDGDLQGVTEISLRNPRLTSNEDIPYEEKFKINNLAINDVIKYYTREAGVRNLEREIAKVCRKATTEIVKGKDLSFLKIS